MALSVGARLGPYEIVSAIGAGGMGEVYRARDTRLDRAVAIKVLAAHLASSPEIRDRFEREARTISQLSHPHICALYDVGTAPNPAPTSDVIQFLVMELLEGDTLAIRLAKGPLSFDQTRRYGIEIAGALEAAHRRGIIHRDLKPGNVMLTPSGVKLLDFGLAKAIEPAASLGSASVMATEMTPADLTGPGGFLGTLQYMSPEQVEGKLADARTDIFAFGAMLYEMATGCKAFVAPTPARLATAILRDDPPGMSTIDPKISLAFDGLVRNCLAKEPEQRWQTAHDVGLQLKSFGDASTSSGALPGAPARRASAAWLPWSLAGVALLVAAGAWLRPGRAVAPPSSPVRFEIAPPAGGAFSDTVETLCIALSPDGSQLAYVAADRGGDRRIWLRPLSAVDARPLAGTEGARSLFWSPDGRSIGFFAADKMKRLDLPGGAAVVLSDIPDGIGLTGTWGDGQILFATIQGQAIFRVPTSGGPATPALQPDRSRGEGRINWPWFLPDGRRFLYQSRHIDGSAKVMLGEIGQPSREVLSAVSNAQYVEPGYLVFGRESSLVGQRFDTSTGQVTGEPFSIADPVHYMFSTSATTFTTSHTGVLAYQSHLEVGRLVWLDRTGRELGKIGEPTGYLNVRISPDGRVVLFSRRQARLGTYDLWMLDVERNVEQRLTSDRTSEINPVWLPGGAVIFSADRGGPPHLFRKDLATGVETEMQPGRGLQIGEDVSPDGKTLLFTQRPVGTFDIWTLPLTAPGKASPLFETPFDEASVRFSPDGRFIAFASDESGRREVYVAPFPPTGAKTRVSTVGGSLPRWRRDGQELFYLSADLHLASVPVRTTPSLVLGTPQPLFAVQGTVSSDPRGNAAWADFDVSVDGKRFLAVIPQAANQLPLTVVLNWPAEVRR